MVSALRDIETIYYYHNNTMIHTYIHLSNVHV